MCGSKLDLIAAKRGAGRPVELEDIRLLELPITTDDACPRHPATTIAHPPSTTRASAPVRP